jgi:N-acetylmuramoyl-L-alanine amidase
MQRAHRFATQSTPPVRAKWICAFTLALVVLGAAPGARAISSAAAFARAQHQREQLERRPARERTKAQYERVLNAYRAIYHRNPGAAKADASILAVAELLAQEGHVFRDETRYRDAIGQYEFLRRQYPATPYRASALLTEGEIWQRDLHDARRARMAYLEFLRLYPRSELAVEASTNLRDLRRRRPLAARYQAGAPAPVWEAGAAEPIIARTQRPAPPRVEQPIESASRTQPEPAGKRLVETAASEAATPAVRGPAPLVTGIRHWSTPVYTRVAIDLQREVRYEVVRVEHPDRVYFDLYGARAEPDLLERQERVTDDGFLRGIRVVQFSHDVTRVVLSIHSFSDYSAFFLSNPPRLIIDVHGQKGAAPGRSTTTEVARNVFPAAAPSFAAQPRPAVQTGVFPAADHERNEAQATRRPTTEPVAETVTRTIAIIQPKTSQVPARRNLIESKPMSKPRAGIPAATESPDMQATMPDARAQSGVPTSMVRALGLKINRIVIDAGHGGHDSGTLGPGGIEEKNVVLDVALRLGRLLHERLGSDVIYTRKTDTFIPLETRTAIANQAQADLFISIHANSSSDPSVSGVETYYLNFTTSTDALQVAARENAASDESIYQLSSLVKKIALNSKIDESREFAADVDQSLFDGLERGNPELRDRGVKKAPFVVLIGANMPSILVEISFLTNPKSAGELRQAAYRERIAEALYRGVAQYVGSLNGMRVAQAGSRAGSSE